MKTVVITEKNSVAEFFVEALEPTATRNDGYFEGDKYIFTWARGHLVTMSYPDKYDEKMKKWSLDTLPFTPSEYKYEVISDARKQFNTVKKLFHRKDINAIYYAGDSAREGLYIQMLIRQEAGHTAGVDEKVVWIDSQTEAEIKRGMREAKDISAYKTKADSGYERAIEDYLMGINFSRALTLKYKNQINNAIGIMDYKSMKSISVGRVMTCVLGMVVDREREIKNFKSTPFYGIKIKEYDAKWKTSNENPLLYSEEGFKEKKDAEALIEKLKDTVTVENKNLAIKKKAAPTLFNLAEFQSEMSRLYKISPQEALDIAQSLYEKKLTTYPRTDARVLSTAVAIEIRKNISGLSDYQKFVDEILSNNWDTGIVKSKYVDDSKISDHYAIIPTGQKKSGLNDLEEKGYDLICRRFLSIFYPPAEIYDITVEFNEGSERFYAKQTAVKSKGWQKVVGISEKPENIARMKALHSLNNGDKVPATYELTEGKTSPPTRYTTGSMILAMENAGKLIEDEELRAQIKGSGIGTSATRGAVIEKVIKNGHLTCDKKTQVLKPSLFGEKLYDLVKEIMPTMLNPQMTASWEKGLSQVDSGEVSREVFHKKLENYIIKTVNDIKAK